MQRIMSSVTPMELLFMAMPACCRQRHNVQSGLVFGSFAIQVWFLMNQDDSGSFRELANIHTVKIIQEFLKDPATRVHLKIAVLEAVSNSTQNIGLDQLLRDMVLEKHDNTWLRGTALRAFAKSIHNDWVPLETLDHELAQTTDDFAAPEVRVDLLRLTLGVCRP